MPERTKVIIALGLAGVFGALAIVSPNGWVFVVLVLICLAAALGVATWEEL